VASIIAKAVADRGARGGSWSPPAGSAARPPAAAA
jgi:hypothetical protein